MEKFKPALNYGLIMALVNTVIFLIIYAIDPGIVATLGGGLANMFLVLLAIPIVFMVLGARDCKANFSFFNFGNAFTAAFVVALVSAIIVMVFNIVFTEFIDPEYEQNLKELVINNTVDAMEKRGVDEETIEKTTNQSVARFEKNEGVLGKVKMSAYGLIWYAILALIIAAVQKDKKNKNEELIA